MKNVTLFTESENSAEIKTMSANRRITSGWCWNGGPVQPVLAR